MQDRTRSSKKLTNLLKKINAHKTMEKIQNQKPAPLKEKEEDYEEVVNWSVVLPILIILAIAVLYAFLW